jgi:hypothetical protein
MTFDIGSAAILAIIVLLAVVLGAGFLKRRPAPLNREYFTRKWQESQGFCKDKATWPLAVINRLVHETDIRLKEPDVKKALVGLRQALKDLGAL